MCARYNLRITPQKLAEVFDTVRQLEFVRRYNISPTQTVVAIRQEEGRRAPVPMRWGLVPSWSKGGPKDGPPRIIARGESVATNGLFRTPFRRQRCLIPATGFYEWEHRGKQKLPYNIHLPGDQPFAFAGLWDTWRGGPEPLESCAIVTTEATGEMTRLKDREPVILKPEEWDLWLDPELQEPEPLLSLLHPWTGPREFQPVATTINSSKNEGEQFFQPLDTHGTA